MTTTGQDIHIMRGDRFSQPFSVTLDWGRVLNGSETWRFHVRLKKADTDTRLELTSPTEIMVDATTHQPTVEFFEHTLTVEGFPTTEEAVAYWYDLVMIKDGASMTMAQARLVVTSDVERP